MGNQCLLGKADNTPTGTRTTTRTPTHVVVATTTAIYLHGFGCTNPEHCRVGAAVRRALDQCTAFLKKKKPAQKIQWYAPCYHPHGDYRQTRVLAFLRELRDRVMNNNMHDDNNQSQQLLLVGYSFGGYLAALFAMRHAHLCEQARLLLLAPAIDNYQRNYELRAHWHMPTPFVHVLRDELAARPHVPPLSRTW